MWWDNQSHWQYVLQVQVFCMSSTSVSGFIPLQTRKRMASNLHRLRTTFNSCIRFINGVGRRESVSGYGRQFSRAILVEYLNYRSLATLQYILKEINLIIFFLYIYKELNIFFVNSCAKIGLKSAGQSNSYRLSDK